MKISYFDIVNIKNNAYLYVEPGKIHLDCVSHMFKVNIDLYIFEGLISSEDKKFQFKRKKFKFDDNPNIPTINLLYSLNHYCTFYSIDFYMKYKIFLRTPVFHLQETLSLEENYKCTQCNKYSNKVYFKNELIFACTECLRIKTDLILENRAVNYLKDNYMSRECMIFIKYSFLFHLIK